MDHRLNTAAGLSFHDAASQLAEVGRIAHARGWVPATSGNYSVRLASGAIAITTSGRDKSKLAASDIMQIDQQGQPLDTGTPSAETCLHLQLYQRDERIGSVLHTHSLNATLISEYAKSTIEIGGLELLKAFHGIDTHESAVTIPVMDNSQDIEKLAQDIESHMQHNGQGQAYLIRGHGLYTWGRDLNEGLRHLEALEFLLEYGRAAGLGSADIGISTAD